MATKSSHVRPAEVPPGAGRPAVARADTRAMVQSVRPPPGPATGLPAPAAPQRLRSAWLWAVELRDALPVIGRGPGPLSAADLGLVHPVAKRLGIEPELPADTSQRALALTGCSRISNTIPTSRSRNSSGYFFGAGTGPLTRGLSASISPWAVQAAASRIRPGGLDPGSWARGVVVRRLAGA